MFKHLKNLFRGKKIVLSPGRQEERQRLTAATQAAPATASSGEDFGTSYIVGMATNNAFAGAMVGSSVAGGIMGDLARDGALGDAESKSHMQCDNSAGSGYDSGSDGGGCDSGSD